ncbi:MAG: hypothetical protein V5A59_09075 [Bacteroidales bacterium]
MNKNKKLNNMKTYTKLIFIALLIFANIGHISGQNIGDLHGINYQAVAIDEDGKEIVGMDMEGKPLYEKEIGVRFTIQKGEDGQTLYQETHTTLTDQQGLFSLTIGKGNPTGGEYTHLNDIPWIDADQWLKVEISIENDGNYRVVSNQQFMSVPYSFYTDNIADNAITTAKILNHTIQNEDIDTGSVDTRTILDGTIQNEDIANETINLTQKVRDTLPVENGGTGRGSVPEGSILVGQDANSLDTVMVSDSAMILTNIEGEGNTKLYKFRAGTGTSLSVDSTNNTITVNTTISGEVDADGTKTLDIGTIAPGDTYVSPSFPVPEESNGEMGDIVLASIDKNLRGCMLTPYFFSTETIKVAIFNGTGSNVNLGNNVNVKLLIVQ